MDTWDIPYQRRALPMVGGTVSAPLGQCRDNFDTEDSAQCVNVEHDTRTGNTDDDNDDNDNVETDDICQDQSMLPSIVVCTMTKCS